MMRAAIVRSFGGPEVITVTNVPKIQEVADNQVLVRNYASGVNPVDTYIRSGTHGASPALPYIVGKDGAGVVEKVGKIAGKSFKIGDRVWYGLRTGSAAEFSIVENPFPLPDDVSFAEGASLGVPYLTAYRALFILGSPKPDDVILVHGASGGVGSAAVQLAKWKGFRVVGTAGTEKGIDFIKGLGADEVFNHREHGYIEEIKKKFPQGFNLILEMAAHINLNTDCSLLSSNGRVAVIGNRGETQINARLLMLTEGQVYGVALGRSTQQELQKSGDDIVRMLTETTNRPAVYKTYRLEEISTAHRDVIENSGTMGNLVVEI